MGAFEVSSFAGFHRCIWRFRLRQHSWHLRRLRVRGLRAWTTMVAKASPPALKGSIVAWVSTDGKDSGVIPTGETSLVDPNSGGIGRKRLDAQLRRWRHRRGFVLHHRRRGRRHIHRGRRGHRGRFTRRGRRRSEVFKTTEIPCRRKRSIRNPRRCLGRRRRHLPGRVDVFLSDAHFRCRRDHPSSLQRTVWAR